MLDKLIIGLIVVAIVLIGVILVIVKRGRMPIKFAIVWLIPGGVILALATFPEIFMYFSAMLGFQTISNLVVGILFVLLFLITMALTVIAAGQTTKINLLIQEISILKKEILDNDK